MGVFYTETICIKGAMAIPWLSCASEETGASIHVLPPQYLGLTFSIAVTFYKHLSHSATEMSVKFQSGTIIIACNLATSKLHDIWG